MLLLEAGKQVDTTAELKSLEWPYDHPRRGDMPYTSHALRGAEYALRKPPYAPKDSPWKTVQSYVQGWSGSDYSKNILVDEKEHPYTGTSYAWVRARVLGGKTNIWGRLALRLSDYDFKGKSHDGWGEDWPISYADIEPYYDKVDLYLGISGHPEGLAHLPDSKFQRATRLNAAEVMLRQSMAKSGKVLTPVPRGRDHRRPQAQQVPQPLLRARGLQSPRGRLRHPRRLRLPHRPHLSGPGDGAPDRAHGLHRARGHRRSRHGQGARRLLRGRGHGRPWKRGRRSWWSARPPWSRRACS